MGRNRKYLSKLSIRQYRRRINKNCELTYQVKQRKTSRKSKYNKFLNNIQGNNIAKTLELNCSEPEKIILDATKDMEIEDFNVDLLRNELHSDQNPEHQLLNCKALSSPLNTSHSSFVIENKALSIQEQLAKFVVKEGVNHSHLNGILKILRSHSCFKDLPKNARILLRTPRKITIRNVHPGNYCHFGIKPYLYQYLDKYNTGKCISTLKIQIGIDGLPLSKCSRSELWPIMGCVIPETEVFLIGCYHGPEKPSSSNVFIEEFVDEMVDLTKNGIEYYGTMVHVIMHSIIADAPAKSFLTCTKGHSGYYSCPKCKIEGEYLEHRVCFPGTSCTKRSDKSFVEVDDDEYHSGYTILNKISDFGIVTQIPLDYMHLVCIGVTKRMIQTWLRGKHFTRLSTSQVKAISDHLIILRGSLPKEFARRPRAIDSIDQWKATELRQFLLYTGPLVLKNQLHKSVYNHFMILHIAMRILSSENVKSHIDYAESLLKCFVEMYEVIYKRHSITFNIHGLLHLTDDVRKFGPVDSFSAFRFENCLKTLKNMIRKPELPLHQLYNRYVEKTNFNDFDVDNTENFIKTGQQHSNGPLTDLCTNPQFNSIQFKNFFLSRKEPNNVCALDDGSIIFIYNFATSIGGEINIIGKKFCTLHEFYTVPCNSSVLQIFKVKNVGNLKCWPLQSVRQKYVSLPRESGSKIVIPLLHC